MGIRSWKSYTFADHFNGRRHQNPLLRGTHQNSATTKLNVYNTLFREDHRVMSFIEAPKAIPAPKAVVAIDV